MPGKMIGIVGGVGCYASIDLIRKVYPNVLQKYGIEVIQPSQKIQSQFVHPSIYDKHYGIKAVSSPVTEKAKNDLITAASYFSRKGADAIILGCTEISLAITESKIENSVIIDACSILATALIRESRDVMRS